MTTSGRQLCIDGLQHGKRYKVKLRAGIPAQIDDDLKKSVELSVYVKDRSPSVRLSGNKYVLPRSGQIGIPVTSVNTKIIYTKIYRFSDRGLGTAVQGEFLKQLAGYNIEELKRQTWRAYLGGHAGCGAKTQQGCDHRLSRTKGHS